MAGVGNVLNDIKQVEKEETRFVKYGEKKEESEKDDDDENHAIRLRWQEKLFKGNVPTKF